VADRRLQEIVTRAVVGRAEHRMTWSHTVPAEGITGVFGVHVTDSAVAVSEQDGHPVVELVVHCDLWCGSQRNTKVVRAKCQKDQSVHIRTVGKVMGDAEISVRLVGTPRATDVRVGDGQITLVLEADVVVEMCALTRMWVQAYSLDDDVLEDWDDMESSGSSSGISEE
jgi:hypothetical protein